MNIADATAGGLSVVIGYLIGAGHVLVVWKGKRHGRGGNEDQ
jgi:hypothetical protein